MYLEELSGEGVYVQERPQEHLYENFYDFNSHLKVLLLNSLCIAACAPVPSI